jgi:nucleoside-diphosphate-sugar epimerase
MRVLIAGASGAIGQPLMARLKADGHTVIGMARSAEAARVLTNAGAEAVIADAVDAGSVKEALARARPDAVINELTSLPQHYTPEEMRAAVDRDRTVRLRGNENLLAGMQALGIRRYILQSSGFWYGPGAGLATEEEPFAPNASPGVAAGIRTYQELEAAAFGSKQLEVAVLRYGFFYGPGTWYTKEGDVGEQVRQRQIPVIGKGQGVWSFVHIDDAAAATVVALACAPVVYNVVDDTPCEQRTWLPAFARYAGAPEPPKVTEEQALEAAGPDVVYYATRLRGASNRKAKRELRFNPRPLGWLTIDEARTT